jgi:ElaB/YqjD/DUF883 family membrane-anchored ribosome-binding protein
MNARLENAAGEVTKEKLMKDLRLVVADAEELLRATTGVTGEKVASVRQRIQENLEAARIRLSAAEVSIVAKTKMAAGVTDEYVHENPWRVVGVGAAVGVIVGMLIGRGR